MSCQLKSIIGITELTFSNREKENFRDSLNALIRRVSTVKAADLHFNPDKLNIFNTENAKERFPPVTTITIKETPSFSMEIFILQNGSRIPLHDHPDMYGILKVINGTVKHTSYSRMSCIGNETEIPHDVKNKVRSCQLNSLIPVELKMSANVTATDQPCVLMPTEGNYHEVCAVGGTAVIFDILSPPYGERDCHFYNVLESEDTDSQCKIWLAENTDPPNFWCD